MDSEDYIELPPIPPSDSEEGYDGDGASILQKVNKEDSNGGEGDDKIDLHEDSNQYERKNSPYVEDVCKEGIAAGNCKVNHVKSGLVGENGSPFVNESESVKVDISPRSLKRPRLSYNDDQPYVHVVYNHLSSESKKKLSELLQNWSEWHAQNAAKVKESTEEPLESGDDIYFPALHVGEGNTSMMTYWMDKPAKHILKDQTKDYSLQGKEASIPYYDRACAAPLTIQDGSTKSECNEVPPNEASRCFNCGSYNHSLKDCSKPRDNAAITNARNQHKLKRTPASGPRCPQRYYQNSPGGKFEGIKPGMLGSETRQSLGIGELDPPPWLNRMREIGYPPGYLDSDGPDEPSGIIIYRDDENMELEEEGEIVGDEPSKLSTKKMMTVHFPGINAPIPENADERLWNSSFSGPDKSDSEQTPCSSTSVSRGHRFDQTRVWDYNSSPDEQPPGTERVGNSAFGSDYASRSIGGNNTPSPNYSSRNHFPRSPNLTRSVSDSGRRTPIYDSSPRAMHGTNANLRHGEHSWSPYGQYSSHTSLQYSSPSPGRYSPQIQSPGSSDYMPPERRHAWSEAYAALDRTHRKERSEVSHHYRK